MEQQITVYDENNVTAGTTFRRRAKQLVHKRRAYWLDETYTAICLTPELKEEIKLDKVISNQTNSGYEIVDEHGSEDLYEKECLRCLAKKRVREKKGLLKSIATYIVGCIFLLILNSNSYYDSYSEGITAGIAVTWGVFLLYHIAVYFYSRLKGAGILKHFNQDPVEMEYKKLKTMTPSKVAMEYRRL